MIEILQNFHERKYIERTLGEIKDILLELYGREQGTDNYNYLLGAAGSFLGSLSEADMESYISFNPSSPYDHLKGKIFAICYPDNIYTDSEPTLKTLGYVLSEYFPSVNGIHILPERVMSHADVWPQDFFSFLSRKDALELVRNLQKTGVLNKDRYITSKYQNMTDSFFKNIPEKASAVLDKAFNSHFNDGGFSQVTRAMVDPRFGTLDDIGILTKNYSVMLDYVVNHVDIDSNVLESYKKGTNSGDAFLIITPSEYTGMKSDGSLYKTFRPRPFPLYTGMRKYPESDGNMNEFFTVSGLESLDVRVINFLSIYFKVENDQGLTAGDKRIFVSFLDWVGENGLDDNLFFDNSSLQAGQKIIKTDLIKNMAGFLKAIDIAHNYADVFNKNDDIVFGEKFFVYTTFSESQLDINPMTKDGFKMIIDDLYLLLSSGKLSMMRMDAIKYLWKEKGKKNFDMPEGNKFIDLVRKLMALTAPGVLPLDEINSPDPVVYEMSKGGVFAYLFGVVNSTVTAFNEGTLQPLKNYYKLYQEKVPDNFVPFIMLSTHDGRSVQGLGVHRMDGHVSIEQFYHLKDIIEEQGGMAKYRTVSIGEISSDTFTKVIEEAKLVNFKDELMEIFTPDSVASGDTYILNEDMLDRDNLLKKISEKSGFNPKTLANIPSIDYLLDWILDGKTIYELCATTRSSLRFCNLSGLTIDPVLEAVRLALAQGFVLTIGQSVPAIYFNDLLGIKNDLHGYKISGKPRDLNRHKSYLPDMNLADSDDPYYKTYFSLLNRILKLRSNDNAFYPGSDSFEFLSLTDILFLNHPYHEGNHSLILGNISENPLTYKLILKDLAGVDNDWIDFKRSNPLADGITGTKFLMDEYGCLNLELPPFGMLWLK